MLPLDMGTAQFELTLVAAENRQRLALTMEYNADLFDAATIDRLLAQFQTLVEEEPGTRIDSYTITGAEVSVVTSEPVSLPFRVFTDTVVLHAHATARLAAGYDGPV